jgi:uncharacterized protein YbbC (DUF1343 family)
MLAGLDTFVHEGLPEITGTRIGVIVNQTGIDHRRLGA